MMLQPRFLASRATRARLTLDLMFAVTATSRSRIFGV